jgi:uncharacterized protein
MYYPRKIFPSLLRQLSTPEIVVLTGMRRVGKTTLMRMLAEKAPGGNVLYLDIENPLERRAFEERDYRNILGNLRDLGLRSSNRGYVFLDEIQSFPEIVKPLKYLFDHYAIKFIVTGSSSYYLKNLFPESLAGRKTEFTVYPLDFSEFVGFRGGLRDSFDDIGSARAAMSEIKHGTLSGLFDEYCSYGGFPQVVLTEDADQKILQLKDIMKSYFEKDVVSLAHVRDVAAFRDVFLLLLSRIGTRLDISKIASETGLTRDTVYSYIAFLEGTFCVSLIPPYTRNIDREIRSSRKIYCCDPGFLNPALRAAQVSEGCILENAVFLNLRKYGEVRYYQRRSGQEIDFVLPGPATALEVKMSGHEQDFRKLSAIAASIGLKTAYVVTRRFKPGNEFIPVTAL